MPLLLALQDLPGALSDAQVAEGLGLTSIKSRDWSIFKTSGAWWLCSWPIVCLHKWPVWQGTCVNCL